MCKLGVYYPGKPIENAAHCLNNTGIQAKETNAVHVNIKSKFTPKLFETD